MRRLLLAALVAVFAGSSHGQDFGGMFKKFIEQVQPGAGESKGEKKAPGSGPPQPGLLDQLAGETPVEQEVKIGRQIAGSLLDVAPLVKDDRLQRYVNRVGRWVASQSERPDLDWHFGVVESDDINAFAMPGGYVFVTRGLYRRLDSEAQLAGVLGHEIGHVVRKHHLNILKQSRTIDLFGKLLTTQTGSRAEDQIIRNIIGNGAEALARGLDKEAEYEADRIGVVLAARAGYDPFGLPAVLQRIGQANPDDGSVSLLFKTHPHPNDRLAKLGDAMGERFDGFTGAKAVAARFSGVVLPTPK